MLISRYPRPVAGLQGARRSARGGWHSQWRLARPRGGNCPWRGDLRHVLSAVRGGQEARGETALL
jgi:hypothetical protein